MARSLNQAFIKAYNKDSGPRERAAARDLSNDEFVLRIDTLNVGLPETHLDGRPPTVPSVADKGEEAAQAQTGSVKRAQPDSQQGSLRDSIADQMLRASEWRDAHGQQPEVQQPEVQQPEVQQPEVQQLEVQQLEVQQLEVQQPVEMGFQSTTDYVSFDGGIQQPTQYQAEQTAYPPAANDRPHEASLSSESGHSSARAAVSEQDYAVTDEPVKYIHGHRNAEFVESHIHPGEYQLEPLPEQAKTAATETSVTRTRANPIASESASAAGGEVHPTADSAPFEASESPRGRQSDSRSETSGVVGQSEPRIDGPGINGMSSAEVERIVQCYIEKHGREGEIFRLDKPSYTTDVSAAEADMDVEQPGELVFEENEISQTAWDVDELDEPAASKQDKAAEAVAAEESLREARVPVFNPVWEVDHLQWPHVCEELIRQRQDSLMQVARNLTKACEQGLQVLAVTSSVEGEGRTTVSCCLAKLAAVSGLRVALVDGDLENPAVAYQTNLELESDWKAALLEDFPIEEIAVHAIEDQVTLIPLLDPVGADELTADDDRICEMLHQLSATFDLVIIDSGPLQSEACLAMTMAERNAVNAIIAVVDRRQSNSEDLEQGLQQIRRVGVSSVGLVENFAD